MTRRATLSPFALCFALLAGCYGDPVRNFGDGAVPVDAPALDAGPDSSFGDGGDGGDGGMMIDARVDATTTRCTDLSTGGAFVPPTAQAGYPPAALGGTLPQGTFSLRAWDVYGGTSTAAAIRFSLRLGAGNSFELARRDVNAISDQLGGGTTSVRNSITLDFNAQCGGSVPGADYNYDGVDLTLHFVDSGRTNVLTFR